MSTKKVVIREYFFGQLMSMLFNLIFLVYHYHELDNHACHQALKILVTLCLLCYVNFINYYKLF